METFVANPLLVTGNEKLLFPLFYCVAWRHIDALRILLLHPLFFICHFYTNSSMEVKMIAQMREKL